MEKSTGEYNERKHKNIFLKKGESTGAACAQSAKPLQKQKINGSLSEKLEKLQIID